MNQATATERRAILLTGLQTDRPGLEVSPLFRPTAIKGQHDVYYTDYTSAEESRRKHAGYQHDEIMDIDFVWVPGKKLIDCAPQGMKFHWAVSSHVLEHVPDPIGWLLEVFEVLEEGATFSLALPDKRFCYDKFRRETDAADWVDVWVRQQKIPSPRQVYDFLSRSVDGSGQVGQRAFDIAHRFEDAKRTYSDHEALNFAMQSWLNNTYFDVHCSVFTPESFVELLQVFNTLGVMNVEISTPIAGEDEFFVTLRKLGEPRVHHPGVAHSQAAAPSAFSVSDLEHARKAFADAVAIQDLLKARISELESRSRFMHWLSRVARKLSNKR